MSEEKEPKSEEEAPAPEEPETAAEGAPEADAPTSPEADGDAEAATEEPRGRVDEDGLPLDRDATIDDVRSTEARHGRIALGCTVLIVALILLFWAIRAGVIG